VTKSQGGACGVRFEGVDTPYVALMARVWEQRQVSEARQQATIALLDAAERLLFQVGYAGVTTRAVAEEAGVKHGLVHYYFGSMDELLTQTLERFVDQLATSLEAVYADPNLTFAQKWRLGAQFWVDEPTSRFPKILLELLAMGWNMPSLQPRLAEVHARFRAIFEQHFSQAMRDYGLDENQFPLKVIVAAVTSFQLGLIVEGLTGVEAGHQELLDWIQQWIDGLDANHAKRS
jgi:AcrR family transcriptional regulator